MNQHKREQAVRQILHQLQRVVDRVYSAHPVLGGVPRLTMNMKDWSYTGFTIFGLEWFHFASVIGERENIDEWWTRIRNHAAPGKIPVLFFRTKSTPWRCYVKAYLPFTDGDQIFMRAEISMTDLCAYVEKRMLAELRPYIEYLESMPGSQYMGKGYKSNHFSD